MNWISLRAALMGVSAYCELKEQSVLLQRLKVNEVRVSGEGGEGLVGGVAIAGGADG